MGKPQDGTGTVTGFVFVHDGSSGIPQTASAGTRVRQPSLEPPYLVVGHSPADVLVSRWPGRLFRAEVVPPTTDEERAATVRIARSMRPEAGYTCAFAVDLVEEISPSVLFGPHGGAVTRVLAAGLALDEDVARSLASARPTAANDAFGRAWDQWIAGQPKAAGYRGRDHRSTVAIVARGAPVSPIGRGFTALCGVVDDSALLRGGKGAFTRNERGEKVLTEPWRTAGRALLDAAMAFGAPHLVDGAASTVLTAAWHAAFGPAKPDAPGAAEPVRPL
ncbi:hypothetical protein AQI88_35535 [Streptomyces cellostaticus]|uniref:Uncharacterized protein n=1 Tax=Streptomyces cellostaticus TaxID=67285 RepID=A0A101NEM8_9ACTN|nr:hypothetical protein [Streptomyces cellostaticus]KUM91729.1 hypothetical protein AQI88_35535 [Streptomyces cellostaticus]GHI04209.1 hypothetical protein Scel_25300 [Streptomyces cellostaticus]